MNNEKIDQNTFLYSCNHIDKKKYIKFDSYYFIGKNFLSNLLQNNVYHDSFELVRNEVVSLTKDNNFPENETDFYTYFCKKYLKIKILPMKIIIDDYFDLIEDIKIIDSNIMLCQNKKDELLKKKTKNSYLDSKENYINLRIDYLINKYQKKREEKVYFLINELSKGKFYTKRDVLFSREEDTKELMPVINYRMKEKKLKKEEITEIDEVLNKFLNFPIDIIKTLQTVKRENPREFPNFISEYISKHNITDEISHNVKINHFLNKKNKEFENILYAYSEKNYFTFNNLLPFFIEGLFYDVCKELNATEKEMLQASLNNKLDFINQRINYFIEYDYFAFSFPILRNKIAHGDLKNTDNDYLANMLLLDLLSVVRFCNSDELPNNSFRKEINFIFDNPTLSQFYLKYTNNYEYFETKIDSFYPEAEKLNTLLKTIKTNDYLEYIKMWKGNPENAIKVLTKLKKEGFEKEKITQIINSFNTKGKL